MLKTLVLCTTLLGMNEALLPECIEYEAEKNDMYLQRCSNIEQISMEDLYGKRVESKTSTKQEKI